MALSDATDLDELLRRLTLLCFICSQLSPIYIEISLLSNMQILFDFESIKIPYLICFLLRVINIQDVPKLHQQRLIVDSAYQIPKQDLSTNLGTKVFVFEL